MLPNRRASQTGRRTNISHNCRHLLSQIGLLLSATPQHIPQKPHLLLVGKQRVRNDQQRIHSRYIDRRRAAGLAAKDRSNPAMLPPQRILEPRDCGLVVVAASVVLDVADDSAADADLGDELLAGAVAELDPSGDHFFGESLPVHAVILAAACLIVPVLVPVFAQMPFLVVLVPNGAYDWGMARVSVPTDGERIKNLRIKGGYGTRSLSKATGIHWTHISRIESGKRQASPDALGKLARVLKVQVKDLQPAA